MLQWLCPLHGPERNIEVPSTICIVFIYQNRNFGEPCHQFGRAVWWTTNGIWPARLHLMEASLEDQKPLEILRTFHSTISTSSSPQHHLPPAPGGQAVPTLCHPPSPLLDDLAPALCPWRDPVTGIRALPTRTAALLHIHGSTVRRGAPCTFGRASLRTAAATTTSPFHGCSS